MGGRSQYNAIGVRPGNEYILGCRLSTPYCLIDYLALLPPREPRSLCQKFIMSASLSPSRLNCGTSLQIDFFFHLLIRNTAFPQPTESSPGIMKRLSVWRDPVYPTDHPGCIPIIITEGAIDLGTTTITLQGMVATFTPVCYHGHPVAAVDSSAMHFPLFNQIQQGWKQWTDTHQGKFGNSTIPLTYSMLISMVVAWIVVLILILGENSHGFRAPVESNGGSETTEPYKSSIQSDGSTTTEFEEEKKESRMKLLWMLSFVMPHKRPRRPLLLRLGVLAGTIYLTIVLAHSTQLINEQYNKGYLDRSELVERLSSYVYLAVLELIFYFIMLLAQVQVVMRVFSRRMEQRMIFWLGGTMSVVCQVLNGITSIDMALQYQFSGSLPAFQYLFQVAIQIMYACSMVYYLITNSRSTMCMEMVPMTLIAIMASSSPVVLFVVDIANAWLVEWSDSLTWISTLLAIVCAWEWIDRVERLERHHEKEGFLGRQLQEDDDYLGFEGGKSIMNPSEFREFTDVSLDADTHPPNAAKRFVQPLLVLSDRIIEAGLLFSRASSTSYDSVDHADDTLDDHHNITHTRGHSSVRSQLAKKLDYYYSKKTRPPPELLDNQHMPVHRH